MIPSRKECLELMSDYLMPEHIKAHSLMVARIADLIGTGLRKAGLDLSLETITAGALLHDIAKGLCFDSHEDHAVKGAGICRLHHFDEIAAIVHRHISLDGYDPDGAVGAEEIVYYADKRVNHDVIVSLEERMAYLFERYAGKNRELQGLIRENFNLCKKVEDKIFACLPFKPDEIELLLGIHELI